MTTIIFGASTVGEVLLKASWKAGVKIDCFCDNNINKTKSRFCGLKVVPVTELKKHYADAAFIISVADIKDVVSQLQALGYTKWHPASYLLDGFDIYRYRYSQPPAFVDYAVSTCLSCQDSYLHPAKLFLRSVDIIITERCSLKCRDCSNLMQYYAQPVDCDTEQVLNSIDKLCSLVDGVNEFRVIGGEPFMNRDYGKVVSRLISEPKVKRVVIYTNGTIIPDIKVLKGSKILVIITDYGILSRKLKELTRLLAGRVDYYIMEPNWTDCAAIAKHNRTSQTQIFAECCAKNLATLSNGRLFRCPFSANAARLNAIPDCPDDYLDLARATKKKIRDFLLKDCLESCDYCNGRSFSDPAIQPAIQITRPLEYKRW